MPSAADDKPASGDTVPTPSAPAVGDTVPDGSLRSAAGQLATLIAASDWFMAVLAALRAADLPDAWTGAGALRDLVWGTLFGPGFHPAAVRDVDVAFFDPSDLTRGRDRSATEALRDRLPSVPWEATNQAAVHTWYHETFAAPPVPPLVSSADGVATWPETATSVAVRLEPVSDAFPYGPRPNPRRSAEPGQDATAEVEALPPTSGATTAVPLGGGERLAICAPLGLDDLLRGVWRRNPRRITVPLSQGRLARHDPARRWSGVRVIEP